jgi:hypothetical protein
VSSAAPVRGIAWEDGVCYCLARMTVVRAGSESNMLQADVSTIDVVVTDEDDTQTLAVTSVTISTSVYDALQTGTIWTADGATTIGYNFAYKLPAAALASGGVKHYAEFKFTLSGGDVLYAVFEIDTLELRRP